MIYFLAIKIYQVEEHKNKNLKINELLKNNFSTYFSLYASISMNFLIGGVGIQGSGCEHDSPY